MCQGNTGVRTGCSETGACGGCSAVYRLCVLQRLWGACLTLAISEDVISRSICDDKTLHHSTVLKGFTCKVLSFFLHFLYPQQYISRVIASINVYCSCSCTQKTASFRRVNTFYFCPDSPCLLSRLKRGAIHLMLSANSQLCFQRHRVTPETAAKCPQSQCQRPGER